MSWTTTTLKLLQMSTVVLSGQERLGVAFTKQSKPYCCWPKVIYLPSLGTFGRSGEPLWRTFRTVPRFMVLSWRRLTSIRIMYIMGGIGRLSIDYRWVARQSVDSQSTVGPLSFRVDWESVDNRSSLYRLFTDSRSTVYWRVGRLSTDSLPTHCQPTSTE